MQVSGVEIPQQQGPETTASRPKSSANDLFAAFLRTAIDQNFSQLRLESGTGLGQQIVRSDTPLSREDYAAPVNDDETEPREAAKAPDEPADNEPAKSTAADDRQPASRITSTSAAATDVVSTAETPDVASSIRESAGTDDDNTEVPADSTVDETAIATVAPEIQTAAAPGAKQAGANGIQAGANGIQAGANGIQAGANGIQAGTNGQQVGGNFQQATASKAIETASAAPVVQRAADIAAPTQAAEKASRITASVTETPQQLVSRPNTTLAPAAAVAAQAGKQQSNGGETSTDAERDPEGSGNLLLNRPGAKHATAGARQQPAPTTANTPTGTPANNTQAAGTNFQTAPAAPLPANQSSAASALGNRPGVGAARIPDFVPQTSASSGISLPPGASATARAATSSPPPNVPARVLTEQIAIQVQKSVAEGQDRIKIQLKPAELGRVEIKLDVMRDGHTKATITVERPETLDLLQRDARGLQQALQNAGLKTDSGGLSFNLSGGNASDGQQAEGSPGPSNATPGDGESDAVADLDNPQPRHRSASGMIDVEV